MKRFVRTTLSLTTILLVVLGCENESIKVEFNATTMVSEVTSHSAKVQLTGAVSTSDETFNWGVIYSLNSDPQIDNKRAYFSATGSSISDQLILESLVADTVYYVQPFCERFSEFYFNEEIITFRTDTIPYDIGQSGPAGGIVYFRSEDGWGMELSTVEFGSNDWGCTDEVLGTSSDLGSGATNTALILSDCPMSGTAPALCNDHSEGGYSDWHLPAYEDLYYVWYNLVNTGEWTPTFTDYLTSTDCTNPSYGYASYNAYDIVNGHGISAQQGLNYHFFPVRRFEY